MNIKSEKIHRIIASVTVIFLSAVYFSFIPIDLISAQEVKKCCSTYSDVKTDSISGELISNTCSCCEGECRCAYKEKPSPDVPFNGITKVQNIPDMSPPVENYTQGFNFSALIFNQNFPDIHSHRYNGKAFSSLKKMLGSQIIICASANIFFIYFC